MLGMPGMPPAVATRVSGGSAVDKCPAAERLRLRGQHPVGSISHVNLSHLSWLTEVHVYVQGVLPGSGEVVCVRKLHVLLTALRSEQHTFTVTQDLEMGMVGHRWDGTGENDGHRERPGQDQATPHDCLPWKCRRLASSVRRGQIGVKAGPLAEPHVSLPVGWGSRCSGHICHDI